MERALAAVNGRGNLVARWITNARYDLLWYLGPCIASYLVLWLHFGLAVKAATLWWVWTLAFDGPHVFGTINRTYFDREEWKVRGGLLLRSLLWFLPGPAIVLASIASGSKTPFYAFLLFANLWAYWHVVRQHYGFLVLYQKKNGEAAGSQNRADWWCFYLLMLLPFVSVLLRNEHGRASLHELGLPLEPSAFERWLHYGVVTLISVVAVFYLGKEVRRLLGGQQFNLPKNLFLLSCVPLHLVVCLHPAIAIKIDPILFTTLVTLYHNFQYTGIVWFYNQNRYHQEDARGRYGVAARIARSFVPFYAVGLLFTVVLRYSYFYLAGTDSGPLMPGPNSVSRLDIGSGFTITELAIAFWWGFAFNHYYLDQHIWRVSKDKALNRELKMA
jgi:hypothetical protein